MVDELFVTPNAARRDRDLLRTAAAAGTRVTLVTDRVADSLSDTVTPQGVVAVVRGDDTDLAAVLAGHPRLLAVLVDVADPGNAGTVIRTADAVGADAVVLAGASVDPHNPKCVRASAGSLFHLPVIRGGDMTSVAESLSSAGVRTIATTLDDDADDLDNSGVQDLLGGPVAWLFGNEAHGLSAAITGLADARVRIP
ncbi:MAG TPA: RNA methyltransferase, partial [Mycobacteriales bacterium]|nr:RNA methyltransferase [Mycobacteriales bacterium]